MGFACRISRPPFPEASASAVSLGAATTMLPKANGDTMTLINPKCSNRFTFPRVSALPITPGPES